MMSNLHGISSTASPASKPANMTDLASVCRLLFHLPPPAGITPVIFERFSPYHFNAAQYGLKLTPFPVYGMLYPKHLIDYEKIAYYFEGEWGQQGDPQEYIQPTIHAYREWMKYWLEMRCFSTTREGLDSQRFTTTGRSRMAQHCRPARSF